MYYGGRHFGARYFGGRYWSTGASGIVAAAVVAADTHDGFRDTRARIYDEPEEPKKYLKRRKKIRRSRIKPTPPFPAVIVSADDLTPTITALRDNEGDAAAIAAIREKYRQLSEDIQTAQTLSDLRFALGEAAIEDFFYQQVLDEIEAEMALKAQIQADWERAVAEQQRRTAERMLTEAEDEMLLVFLLDD